MKPLEEPVLVVVGGGAAGVFGAARAKTICAQMEVVVVEKLSSCPRCSLNLHVFSTICIGLIFTLQLLVVSPTMIISVTCKGP